VISNPRNKVSVSTEQFEVFHVKSICMLLSTSESCAEIEDLLSQDRDWQSTDPEDAQKDCCWKEDYPYHSARCRLNSGSELLSS
jgi:hypothetical protein